MDSRAVASALDTDPKTLRRFLRSETSSVTPVGSGGRYVFDEADLPIMRAEFGVWSQSIAPKPVVTRKPKRVPRANYNRDEAVWAEEGPVNLPDIKQPAILRSVRVSEAARETRLVALMRQAGLTTRPRPSARV
jgi:hypothetical protein